MPCAQTMPQRVKPGPGRSFSFFPPWVGIVPSKLNVTTAPRTGCRYVPAAPEITTGLAGSVIAATRFFRCRVATHAARLQHTVSAMALPLLRAPCLAIRGFLVRIWERHPLPTRMNAHTPLPEGDVAYRIETCPAKMRSISSSPSGAHHVQRVGARCRPGATTPRPP